MKGGARPADVAVLENKNMKTGRILKFLVVALLLLAVAGFGVRAMRAMRGPPLQPWHTHVPVELTAHELDAADWARYLAQEAAIFEDIRTNVTQRLEPDARVPYNRYFEGSPVYPARFAQDWNRSYVMEPSGAPTGAVILLHGLTEGSRGSLANLQMAVEMLQDPALEPAMRERFLGVARDEAQAMARREDESRIGHE